MRGRGRTLPGPRGLRRRLASNNPERDRGKAHRSEISQRHRTNLASQRRRAMTSVETSEEPGASFTTTPSALSRSVGEVELVFVPFGIATELAAAVSQHAQELDIVLLEERQHTVI